MKSYARKQKFNLNIAKLRLRVESAVLTSPNAAGGLSAARLDRRSAIDGVDSLNSLTGASGPFTFCAL